ncbi:MAG: ATP-binding protein [Bacteroidota bacterium]
MKLLTKLTLFITLSKLLIVVLFVFALPMLVGRVSFQYTNYYLTQQKKKVLDVIQRNGLEYYLQGDSTYGSYTMLKEEYISLSPRIDGFSKDTIETSQRIIENDTFNYRVLTHVLNSDSRKYLLEIGKTTATIGEYNSLLQRFTLYALIGLILLSILVDLLYTNILIRPLGKIVRTKLRDSKFPFKESLVPVETSTTDFKFLDRSLIDLMEKIHEAFAKEREFTSNASHELLTPISILQNNIENLMMDESLSEQQQEKLMPMINTLNRLKKIVHSLLYISRIENDQFVKKDVVSIHDLLLEVSEELSSRMEMKDVRFVLEVSSGVMITDVNRDLLFQLCYNLVNNAIKYNKEHGTITVKDHQAHGQPYTIIISDTGVGVAAGEISTVFNRFKKTGKSKSEGFGLGLSIVKSIAVYHGFEISLASQLGEGTTVSIVIPASFIKNKIL